MEITKSHWESHDGTLKLGVPIMKVDQERRIVSGFATLDNVDRQRDIVLSSASKAAFEAFSGNVREMHDKIAAGKVVSFTEKMYFDPDTNKVYEGIYVDVYVSKGAASTWEKVLDGTLTGFSIGGRVTEKEDVFSEELGEWISIIKAYSLSELSLVDAPANQLANVFSVLKMANGETEVSGIAVDVETQDVFWCSDDKLATIGTDGCSACGSPGENIGWIASEGTPKEKAQAITELLKNMTALPAVQKEEGVEQVMADETTVEKADETVAVIEEVIVKSDDDTVVATAEAGAEAVVETTAPEAAGSEIDWKAELASLTEAVGSLSGTLSSITKAVEGLVLNATETNAKVEALGSTINETVTKSQGASVEALAAVTERLGSVEKSIVGRKSADRDQEAPVLEKAATDIWADRFTVRSL